MTELYTELFQDIWKGKPVWEHIQAKELTSVPCFLGKQYNNGSDKKIMVVGRAVNGWEGKFEDCSSLEATVQSVLTQENRLHEFANKYYLNEDGSKYYYAKSSFNRLMKQLVKKSTGSDEHWEERIAWTNLFKVSPKEGNNPEWRLIRNQINTYREILRKEILNAQPDLVVFSTEAPSVSFLDPYNEKDKLRKKYSSFSELFVCVKTEGFGENICEAGCLKDNGDIKYVVCMRPEKRSVEKLVDDIWAAYLSVLDS